GVVGKKMKNIKLLLVVTSRSHHGTRACERPVDAMKAGDKKIRVYFKPLCVSSSFMFSCRRRPEGRGTRRVSVC
ncbi:hypothetical protein BaRGS_00025636, partial [Batillaria attramentaria]